LSSGVDFRKEIK